MATLETSTLAWEPGAHVITREIVRGKIWTVRPVTVVCDTPELIALYMMPGTIYKHPRLLDRDEIPTFLVSVDWRLVDVPWTGGGALYLSRPGDHYMAIAFWKQDQPGLRSWYVNLQDPFRRTPLGFDYLDQELDVIISPDLATWRWKDDDKFEVLAQRGIIPPERARFLRGLADEVVQTRHQAGSLFTLGWDRWTPPSHWRVPSIPDKWDTVP
jgi:Protein of unknown function (DUF402)